MSTPAVEQTRVWIRRNGSRFFHRVAQAKQTAARRWAALRFVYRSYAQLADADAPQLPRTGAVAPAPDLLEAVYRRAIPERLHNLVQLRVAAQIGSVPEMQQRAELCRAGGWTEAQIAAVMLGNLEDRFPEPERLLLRYVDDVTRTPIDVDFQLVRRLRKHYGDLELHEITAAISHDNFRIRFQNASRVR